MRVSVGQFTPTVSTADNIDVVLQLAREARAEGSRLLVLPEYSSYMAPTLDARVVESAEPIDGRFVTQLASIARRHALAIVAGVNERSPDPHKIHNTVVLVSEAGDLVARYRKVHLFDAFGHRESDWVLPGNVEPPPVLKVDDVTFGAETCYDLRFPEMSRVLVDAEADVILVPAQWVPGPLKEEHWVTLLRARAIENTVYVAAANQGAPTGSGRSAVIDPMGVTLADLGDRQGTMSAVIDLQHIKAVRLTNPALDARRFVVAPRPELQKEGAVSHG